MSLKKALHILLAAATIFISDQAMAKSPSDKYSRYHEEIVDLSVEENLMSPEVPKKQLTAIKNRQLAMAKHLKRKGFKVETARDGLAVIVTLQSDGMFMPNDTLLTKGARQNLDILGHYLKTPDFYKVLIVAHSDDTGSEDYLNSLTVKRADAIVKDFEAKGLEINGVIPYGLGCDEPVAENFSRNGRSQNRRVEFYFIPGPEMISQAKAGKLNQ